MLIILIILTALAIWLCIKTMDDFDAIPIISGSGAIILGIIDLIVIVISSICIGVGIVANDKIKMYQEENKQIQESIDTIVMNYMNYEKDTLKEFKVESPVTYVSLYPQLQTDELVKKQIDVYIENNNKIKELKEEAIDIKIGKWLLYFG